VSINDTKELFKRIEETHEVMTYTQALEILTDLAYLVIPFDKTQREF